MKNKVSRELLSQLYRVMLKIRLAELRVAELYPSDKIQSPVHLSIGQEAVSAGVCLALEKTDHVYGTYRGHGIYLAKGGELKKMFAELYGKDTGCARGRGGSMHLVAPEAGLMACSAIVASTIPVAVGDALASKMQKKDRVSAVVFGDGAVDEGVFFESVNFAMLKKLPVIFVLENNCYAIHSKIPDRHAQKELYKYGESLGLHGTRYDGNDAALVYATMKEISEKVRKESGPALVEYMTYRLYEHVGPKADQQESYRDRERLKEALAHDPVETVKKALLKEYKVSETELEQWQKTIAAEIDEAVEFAEKSPFPSPDSIAAFLFAEKKS